MIHLYLLILILAMVATVVSFCRLAFLIYCYFRLQKQITKDNYYTIESINYYQKTIKERIVAHDL